MIGQDFLGLAPNWNIPPPAPSLGFLSRRVLTISPPEMWSAQAQAEGLTLLVAENTTGYFGVYLNNTGQPKPYRCGARLGGTDPLKL